jgi:hypothetical protein
MTEVVSIWKKKIDSSIDVLLNEIPSLKYQGGVVNIQNLYGALEQHDSPCARSLVEDHPHFQKQVLGHFNTMIHNPQFGAQYVLSNIKGRYYEQENSDGIPKKVPNDSAHVAAAK